MLSRCHFRLMRCLAVVALSTTASPISARESAQIVNPISRIARIFDPQLVKTEDRVEWLDTRVSTFAEHREHSMKVGLGYRGFRATADAPDPSVVLDLGRVFPIDTVYLVPAQREFLEDSGIFPKRFTLELSNDANFAKRSVIYNSGPSSAPTRSADGNPVPFSARETARYIRLTVQEGHNKGMLDLFGLSEIAVISDEDPVSFGAAVTATGDLSAQGIWSPAALTDGRTPLGIWQNGGRIPAQEFR